MYLEINPDWSQKCVRYDFLLNICNKIDQLEAQIEINVTQLVNDADQVKQITDQSQLFLSEIKIDFDMINTFFNVQYQKLNEQCIQIAQMAMKAVQISLPKQQYPAIVLKMQETLQNCSILQNYVVNNLERMRTLAQLHDKASKYTYNASLWLHDTCQKANFEDEEIFEQIKDQLAQSYSVLYQTGKRKAIKQIQNQVIQNRQLFEIQLTKDVAASGIMTGIILIILLRFIEIIHVCTVSDNISLVQTLMSQQLIRVHIIIALMFLGLGIIVGVMHNLKLNFVFLYNLPATLMSKGHLHILRNSLVYFCIVMICCCFCMAGQLQADSLTLKHVLGSFVFNIAKILKPLYWMIIPTLLLPLMTFKDIVIHKNQHSVFYYVMDLLYKMFTPWKQKIEFPQFYFCNFLNSSREAFRDIISIIGCDRVPDYILILFMNIFCMIRVIQGYKRFRENDIFYPQGMYMIQYIIGMLPTIGTIREIQSHEITYWVWIAFRCLDTCYKLYWDCFEDWGLFFGGSAAQKFRNKPSHWAYKRYVRRPSQVPLLVIIFFHIFDICALCLWIVVCFNGLSFLRTFWFSCVFQCTEVIRRLVWMIMRLDNQQSTNVENYVQAKYIPLAIKDYARVDLEQLQNQKILDQLTELALVFNQNGKERILDISRQFQTTKDLMQHISVPDLLEKIKQQKEARSKVQSPIRSIQLANTSSSTETEQFFKLPVLNFTKIKTSDFEKHDSKNIHLLPLNDLKQVQIVETVSKQQVLQANYTTNSIQRNEIYTENKARKLLQNIRDKKKHKKVEMVQMCTTLLDQSV
ncbi:EXS_family protein [Hexamita inflata]|uniref:EXS family protein n=1 Tax=Hexamita inflata TaxID=28002 RepID=A0AA86QID7_9EUKA|nr:EXS family protein [Hexamita inflata]